MIIIKSLVFAVIAIAIIIIVFKNVNVWGSSLRQYMLEQANKVFGNGAGWERPWTFYLSKAMIVFFGFMSIVFAFALCFG